MPELNADPTPNRPQSDPTRVLVIRLDERWVECIACGADCIQEQGLPMREGEFLENDDPGEWGGFDACRSCYEIHAAGGVRALTLHLARLRAIEAGA